MNIVGVGGSYVCCLAMIIIFMGLGRAGASPKREDNFYRGIDLSASLSELPTYFSLFWCEKSSMICNTKHSFFLKHHRH